MNEPEKLHLSDWFNAAVAVLLFVCGGLAAFWQRWRTRMHERFKLLEARMAEMDKLHNEHAELIAVAEANMSYINKSLDELKQQTHEQTKLLNAIMMKVR